MDLYQGLDTAYHRMVRDHTPSWLAAITDEGEDEAHGLDGVVAAIRNDRPDPTVSDMTLRALITLGRRDEPDALTVAMHALAPKLRSRLGRAVTAEYRDDVVTDLALVLLDSPLETSRLAARLVNRAHNRTYKAARHAHTRGEINLVQIIPTDPQRLRTTTTDGDGDVATIVARRVDLARFTQAVHTAIGRGDLSETAWTAYRDHRLRRALDPAAPVCGSDQRIAATRTAHKLRPLAELHLHAA